MTMPARVPWAWAQLGPFPLGPWAHLGLAHLGLGPLGPWAHLGPGPTWALGPLGPRAHGADGIKNMYALNGFKILYANKYIAAFPDIFFIYVDPVLWGGHVRLEK